MTNKRKNVSSEISRKEKGKVIQLESRSSRIKGGHNMAGDCVCEKREAGTFGKFDLSRELSDYELEHFDDFMKITNNEKYPENVSFKAEMDTALDILMGKLKR